MAHSVRAFRGRSRTMTAPRKRSWAVGPRVGATPLTLGTTPNQLWGVTAVPNIDGLTLVRLRGEILIYLLTASAVGDGFSGALGICIASDEAVAAGAASIPDPRMANDGDWNGWLFHQIFDVHAATTTAGDLAQSPAGIFRMTIDNKAMRKIPVGSTIVGVLGATEVGTATGEVWSNTRSLILLP